jgi:hypothetical protein
VNAAEILVLIGEAGLEIALVDGALELRGDATVRAEFLPMVAAAAKAIRALVKDGTAPATTVKCHGYRSRACPLHGYIHGKLSADPCDQCGTETWVASVVDRDKGRLCSGCLG